MVVLYHDPDVAVSVLPWTVVPVIEGNVNDTGGIITGDVLFDVATVALKVVSAITSQEMIDSRRDTSSSRVFVVALDMATPFACH